MFDWPLYVHAGLIGYIIYLAVVLWLLPDGSEDEHDD